MSPVVCGEKTSECRLVEVDGLGHFMTRRFDRDGNVRHHQATLSALAFHMIGMDVPFQQHRASWKMGGLPQGRDSAWHVDGRRRPGLCGTEDRRDRDAVAEDHTLHSCPRHGSVLYFGLQGRFRLVVRGDAVSVSLRGGDSPKDLRRYSLMG